MRRSKIIRICFGVGLLSVPFNGLFAQNGPTQDSGVGFGPYAAVIGQVRLTPGAPFIGTWSETRVLKSANGSATTNLLVHKVARDSVGRFYTETRFPVDTPVSWGVIDPLRHTVITWSRDSHQAFLYHDPSISLSKPDDLPPGPWQMLPTSPPWNWDIERLGTKLICGIAVEGMRATRTGTQDNDEIAAIISEERWYSRDLQLAALIVYSDSRTGTFTWKLTGLKRTEPNPTLFLVPSAYQVIPKEMVSISNPGAQQSR
jgi:hypothetical protein